MRLALTLGTACTQSVLQEVMHALKTAHLDGSMDRGVPISFCSTAVSRPEISILAECHKVILRKVVLATQDGA